MDVGRKSSPGRGSSWSKGPEVEMPRECLVTRGGKQTGQEAKYWAMKPERKVGEGHTEPWMLYYGVGGLS